ncbi:MAG: hypothetical protein Q9160_003570 [Pyrenula sp. 1 TL-2023]
MEGMSLTEVKGDDGKVMEGFARSKWSSCDEMKLWKFNDKSGPGYEQSKSKIRASLRCMPQGQNGSKSEPQKNSQENEAFTELTFA